MPSNPDKPIENADPYEQNNPVPKVVMGLVLALVVWGVSYIFLQHASDNVVLGDQRDPAALAGEVLAGAAGVNGAQIFAANCQACHQASGQGLPGVFPPLAGSPWVKGDPSLVSQILLHGMSGPIDVLGTTYNGAMPAFGGQLNDAQLAAVLSHIRSEWGNAAAPVDEAAMADARKTSAERTQAWHGPEELEKFLAEHKK